MTPEPVPQPAVRPSASPAPAPPASPLSLRDELSEIAASLSAAAGVVPWPRGPRCD